MIRERRERLIVYRAATLDANSFRFFLFFSVLHISEEKQGKFDMYSFSNDCRELCSYLIMFFYSTIFKKRKLFKRAYMYIIFNVFLFFLSIQRVDTACKRLRKKRGKFWKKAKERDRSLWPKIIFSLSRLVEATFLFDHHPFFFVY